MSFLRSLAVRVSHLVPHSARIGMKWTLGIPDHQASLKHMKSLGFKPSTILDIGAYIGLFSKEMRSLFPEAAICMFEAQTSKKLLLEEVAAKLGNAELKTALLSSTAGREVEFNLSESGSSMFQNPSAVAGRVERLITTTADDLLTGTRFGAPNMVKIDVQGAEYDVLLGAVNTLRSVEVLVIETSLAPVYQGGKLFHEVVALLAQRDLLLYDVCYLWRNTPTKSVNEIDLVFVRRSSQLFAPAKYGMI